MVSAIDYQVALRDLDGFRHLSHIRMLELLELARIDLYTGLRGGSRLEDIDLIMGEVVVRYLAPAEFGDRLVVAARVSGVGRSSLAFDYEVWRRPETTIALARTTCVCFDYASGSPKPLAPPFRAFAEGTDPLPRPTELRSLPEPGAILRAASA